MPHLECTRNLKTKVHCAQSHCVQSHCVQSHCVQCHCALSRRCVLGQCGLLAVVLLMEILNSTTAFGQAQTHQANFVTRGSGARSSLTVRCEIEGGAGNINPGEVKIEIVNNSGPSTVERNLQAVFYLKSWGGAAVPLAFRIPLRLEEGQSKTSVRLPFVASYVQSIWALDVFEDGRNIRDNRKRRSTDVDYNWLTVANYQQDYYWGGLLASDAKPNREQRNFRAIETLMNDNKTAATRGIGVVSAVALSSMTPLSEASTDWRNYYRCSAWILSADAVAEINAKFPQIGQTLRTYLSAGGSLIVYEVGSPEATAELNRLLNGNDHPDEREPWYPIAQYTPTWWSIEDDELVEEEIVPNAEETLAGVQLQPNAIAHDALLLADTWAEFTWGGHITNACGLLSEFGFDDLRPYKYYNWRDKWLMKLESQKLIQRSYAHGTVIAVSQAIYELPKAQLTNLVYTPKTSLNSKATSAEYDGEWFFQNIIEEVGKPPVWVFCGIVVLFGTILGPGLLWFTGRMERRSLMIFLAPMISMIATAIIVAYGILHEGFETYVRVHSLTSFDTTAQVGFSWSRQNFFSGMPPNEGMKFPLQCYVRQVFDTESARGYPGELDPRRGTRNNIFIGESQIWQNALRPRQHQQFLVGHPANVKSVPISTERDANSGELIIKNLTSRKIPFVFARGQDEDYYLENDIQPGEVRPSPTRRLEDLAAKISKLSVDYKPEVPDELKSRNSLMNFGTTNRGRWGGGAVATNDLVMNAYTQYLSDKTLLQPFQYITLLEEFDQIIVPVQGQQSTHKHLILGIDPW